MRKWSVCACAVMLLLSGCAFVGENKDGAYQVYGLSELSHSGGKDAVCAVAMDAYGENAERLASDLLGHMIALDEESCKSALPKGTRVLDVTVENGMAVVNLSEEYGELSGIELTLADYCITLTLSQIQTVDRVGILAQGEEIPYRDEQSFSAADVLLSAMDEEIRTLWVRLYYPKTETGELASESRNLQLSEGQSKVEAVMEALLQGPQNESLYAVIPGNVRLLSARMDDGICYLNLSKEFIENRPGSLHGRENVIYSIVKTLCSLSDVQAVQLAVEGETVGYYGGIDIGVPLS